MPHGCSFNEKWLEDPLFKDWIQKNENDLSTVKCKVCRTCVNVSSMGRTALTSHIKGKKHSELMKHHLSANKFVFNRSSLTSSASSSKTGSDSSPSCVPSTITSFVQKSETLKAEIWWSVRCVMKNHSYHSNSDVQFYLKNMFPDSQTANAFTMGETKAMYLTVYGLAPHCKSVLLKDLESKQFSLLFDESLNKSTHMKQLDVHIRFWHVDSVITRYLDSFMLGHAKADDLFSNLYSLKESLNFHNILQISMDGPNVNWCMYDKFCTQLKSDYGVGLVNVGSCGLHQVHNAFRAAVKETSWDMESYLSCLYIVFKDVPARRADFTECSGSTVFPLKYCPHRWVENQRVMLRAREMNSNVNKYISAVQRKEFPDPKTNSFNVVKNNLKDKTLPAKLTFLINMCKPIETFLTVYQRDAPMLPFLFADLKELMRKIIRKFVKPSVMESAHDLSKIDFKSADNLVTYQKINIGLEAEELVKTAKCSEREVMEFKIKCREFMVKFVTRLLEKSPLNYSFTKYCQCLSPQLILVSREQSVKFMKSALLHLKTLGQVKIEEIDTILEEFEDLCTEAQGMEKFRTFNHTTMNVDQLFHEVCSQNPKFKNIWPLIQSILLLSHGQASVERGFSTNKELNEHNMVKQSLVSKRLVKDYVLSIGGIEKFKISADMLRSCSLARTRYSNALLEKQTDRDNCVGKKRKVLNEEVSALKKRKTILSETVKALHQETDEKGDKAEKEKSMKTQLVLFTQANALRKAAREKGKELEEVEKEIQEKESLLKSL